MAESSEEGSRPQMTVESVHLALDEVRPYLIADGGDVTVAAVELNTGTVFLRLEVCSRAWTSTLHSTAPLPKSGSCIHQGTVCRWE